MTSPRPATAHLDLADEFTVDRARATVTLLEQLQRAIVNGECEEASRLARRVRDNALVLADDCLIAAQPRT